MQQEQIILPAGVSVRDPAGERYVIETLLGEGGSGAVYLVRDQSAYPKRFALKEVINPDKHDRERFTFEGQVLWSLEPYRECIVCLKTISSGGSTCSWTTSKDPTWRCCRKSSPSSASPWRCPWLC